MNAKNQSHRRISEEELIRRGAEAPAALLERGIVAGERIGAPAGKLVRGGKRYWHMLGPGLTTGASDDDPSGIATYSQVGAAYGYRYLWMAPWLYPFTAVVQEICARIGLVTGRGLAANIRVHYSRRVLKWCALLLFVANTANLGADLGAMAQGVRLLAPHFSFTALVIFFTLFSLVLQIFTPYARYARYLKWLAMVLIGYIFSALLAHLNWGHVLSQGFVPHIPLNKDGLIMVCAVLGTTISPYLFFWQTSQEVEDQISKGMVTEKMRRTASSNEEIKAMRTDVWSGILLTVLVMFFIIAASGGVLFSHGITNINSAAQAAEALRPFAGNATYFLFAIGIIGTGLLTIPVLAASTSYTLSESFGWKEGLYRKLPQAQAFYGVIIIAMLVGLAINFIGINPIRALIYSAILNGLVAPVILFFIMRLASSKKLMGRWVAGRVAKTFGWITTAAMAIAGVAAIIALVN